MPELKYIGKPAQRVDALEKVLGTAKYAGDYQLPGMLHARCLRSELPHARIIRLDVTPALQVPENVIESPRSGDESSTVNVHHALTGEIHRQRRRTPTAIGKRPFTINSEHPFVIRTDTILPGEFFSNKYRPVYTGISVNMF
jgi:hypothetical protein